MRSKFTSTSAVVLTNRSCLSTQTTQLLLQQASMADDNLVGFLIQALQSANIEQLMYPPTATQPSTIYKDPPLHDPFLCNRVVFFFESLIKCVPRCPCRCTCTGLALQCYG